MERHLKAILAMDMAGYSRLMERDETGTLMRLKSHRTGLIDPTLARYRGRIVKEMGDGLLVEFASVTDAVQCAVDIQREVAQRETALPDDQRIFFRVGINLGDVIVDGADIFGDGINVASRLEQLAEPGGICISGTAHDTIRSPLDVSFEPMGTVQIKNISRPIKAYRVDLGKGSATAQRSEPAPRKAHRKQRKPGRATAAAALVLVTCAALAAFLWSPVATWIGTRTSAGTDMAPSVAMFPLRTPAGTQDLGYLAAGIAEDLAVDISQHSGLLLITFGADESASGNFLRTARGHGADYALSGSLRRQGTSDGEVRVTVQLASTESGLSLFARSYRRTPDRLVTLSRDISRDILAALPGQAGSAARTDPPENDGYHFPDPRAYDELLRGNVLFAQFNPTSTLAALDHYDTAISIDPEYARPVANSGFAIALQIAFGWSRDPATDLQRARAFIDRALELNPRTHQAYLAQGLLERSQRNYDAALKSFEKAIEYSPNNPDAYAMIALTYVFAGKPEDGLKSIRKAIQRNPSFPFFYRYTIGMALFHLERYEESVEQFSNALDRNSDFLAARLGLVSALAHLDRMEDAQWEMEEVLVRFPEFTLVREQARTPYADTNDLLRYIRGLQRALDAGQKDI